MAIKTWIDKIKSLASITTSGLSNQGVMVADSAGEVKKASLGVLFPYHGGIADMNDAKKPGRFVPSTNELKNAPIPSNRVNTSDTILVYGKMDGLGNITYGMQVYIPMFEGSMFLRSITGGVSASGFSTWRRVMMDSSYTDPNG